MRCPRLAFLSLCCALAASGQYATSDRIVLPADKTDAPITLQLRSKPPGTAKVNFLPFVDSKDATLSPQPVITEPVIAGDKLQLRFSRLYFWGEARIKFQILSDPVDSYTYVLQRGPALASAEIHAGRGSLAEAWLYNFDTQPLNVRWRIVSGTESVCGIEPNGQPRRDCGSVDQWSQATIGPARSDVILFVAPDAWFNRFRHAMRQAQLELRFGNNGTAPLLRVPLNLHLGAYVPDALAYWIPSWVASSWSTVLSLIRVTFWVTFGAVLLMLAQVMIPNFRKCLRMENEIEALQERLKAISSGVGGRLYSRCQQELESVRVGLAMSQAATKSGFLSVDRLALAGNTAEVNRLAGILPRIESRIGLTERLDERQSAALEFDSGDTPPSLCWNRVNQLRNVQGVLARQFITDSDEKSASASLDLLADAAALMKDFATELEARITGIRRQLDTEPWKTRYVHLISGLNGCAELLQDNAKPVPDGGWNTDELILRDLAAVRLSIISQMIALEPLLNASPGAREGILKRLQSSDPAKLADARAELLKLSQGISEQDVSAALARFMWDVYSEPTTVTDQDVLRVSFSFRNKEIDRCAAKNSFRCFWRITFVDASSSSTEGWTRRVKRKLAGVFRRTGVDAPVAQEVWESGWDVQFIPWRGAIKVTPEIYDADGNEVTIRPATDAGKNKGVISLQVGPPPRNTLHKRLLRGLIDASITAVVPVITVALTQVQNGSALGIDKLVLLGFTSQAIRAAVVPESVSATPEAQPAKVAPAATHA